MPTSSGIKARVEALERHPVLPPGVQERFTGYGVIALPFASGHVLALRRYPASSIGRAYTAVWMRAPAGAWTFFSDASPEQSCARYASSVLEHTITTPIRLWWSAPRVLHVEIPAVSFAWRVDLTSTVSTRLLGAVVRLVPNAAWERVPVLRLAERVAGWLLARGRLALHGQMPNGHRFRVVPRHLLSITSSRAILGGRDFGDVRPLPAQARLGDLWLPQAGVFAIADAWFEEPA